MTEVDTSIYKNTTPPINPLQTFGQVVGIQNAQQQNRLLQQQQDLRAGMGAAFQQSVNPTTGQVDSNKLQAIVSQDPRTAWNTGDVVQQAQGNDTLTANAQVAKLQNVQAHIQAASGYIATNLGNPQLGVSDQYDTIVKGINDMASHGDTLMTPQERDQMIAQVPKGDPVAQKQFVLNAANQNFAAQKQIQPMIDQAYGTNGTANTGQKIVGVNQQSATRGGGITVPPQQGVQQVTDPRTNADLVTVTLENGQKIMVPRLTLEGASGVAPPMPGTTAPPNRLVAPAVPGGYLTTADAATASGPMGQQPPSTTNPGYNLLRGAMADNYAAPNMPRVVAGGGPTPPNATSGTVQTPPDTLPAPPAANGPILAAPPPGVVAGQEADVTRYKTDQAQIPQRAQNVQSLETALHALDAMGSSGKSTESTHAMYSFLSAQGALIGPLSGLNDDVKNYDIFRKYTTQYAANAASRGGQTDLGREMSEASNAGTSISTAANRYVLQTNIGRENQAIAMVKSQAPATNGIGYGNTASQFSETNPLAFGWHNFNAAEQQKIVGGMTATQKANLLMSLQRAQKAGLPVTAGNQ